MPSLSLRAQSIPHIEVMAAVSYHSERCEPTVILRIPISPLDLKYWTYVTLGRKQLATYCFSLVLCSPRKIVNIASAEAKCAGSSVQCAKTNGFARNPMVAADERISLGCLSKGK